MNGEGPVTPQRIVAYHGTNQTFDRFSAKLRGWSTRGFTSRLGFFFTDSKEEAGEYAMKAAETLIADYAEHHRKISLLRRQIAESERQRNWPRAEQKTILLETLEIEAVREGSRGARILTVALDLGRVRRIEVNGYPDLRLRSELSYARRHAYDGVVLENISDSIRQVLNPTTHYVVFYPDNITILSSEKIRQPSTVH